MDITEEYSAVLLLIPIAGHSREIAALSGDDQHQTNLEEADPMSDDNPNRSAGEILQRAEQTMIAAMNSAIEAAQAEAAREFDRLGYAHHRPAIDYFNFAALRFLYLQHCGADPETGKGGDPERAARMIYIAGKSSRYWQRETGQSVRAREAETGIMSGEDEKERADLAHATERSTLKAVIQALVEHANTSDPGFRERIVAAAEASLAKLDPMSEQTDDVAEHTRSSLAQLMKPPAR